MKLLRRLMEIVLRLDKTEKLDNRFTFPYSSNKTVKQQQVWDNLQKGILLEDKGILLPWLTSYDLLDNYNEKREDSGDRTRWYLGKRTVLDGYEGDFEVMKWMWIPGSKPFERITAHLGFGKNGHLIFLSLLKHLSNLLGDPTKIEIEYENENFTEGRYEWQNGKIQISVSGFDMHGARYRFEIGLIDE